MSRCQLHSTAIRVGVQAAAYTRSINWNSFFVSNQKEKIKRAQIKRLLEGTGWASTRSP